MSDDELSAFICENKIEFYRGPNPEAEREAEIFKAIERAKPGRKQGKLLVRASDKEIARKCLTRARGNARAAMRYFIDEIKSSMSEKAAKSGSDETTARNRWYEATESYGSTHRVRRK